MPQKCYYVNVFSHLTIANFLNIAPRGDAKQKCHHVNVSSLKIAKFPRHRPQAVMQYLIRFSDVSLKRMARSARQIFQQADFQYVTHFSYGFLQKKRARSAENA